MVLGPASAVYLPLHWRYHHRLRMRCSNGRMRVVRCMPCPLQRTVPTGSSLARHPSVSAPLSKESPPVPYSVLPSLLADCAYHRVGQLRCAITILHYSAVWRLQPFS